MKDQRRRRLRISTQRLGSSTRHLARNRDVSNEGKDPVSAAARHHAALMLTCASVMLLLRFPSGIGLFIGMMMILRALKATDVLVYNVRDNPRTFSGCQIR